MPKVRPVDATDGALLVGTYKEFLPESEGRAGGALGVAETPEVVGRLLTGGGARKVVCLVSFAPSGVPADFTWEATQNLCRGLVPRTPRALDTSSAFRRP